VITSGLALCFPMHEIESILGRCKLPSSRNRNLPKPVMVFYVIALCLDAALDPVHETEVVPGSLLAELTGRTRLGVNSTHHQAVDRVAEPFEVIARAPDGIVEAMGGEAEGRSNPQFLLSVQFHPERLADRHPEHRAIFDGFVAACAEDARQRNSRSPTHTATIGAVDDAKSGKEVAKILKTAVRKHLYFRHNPLKTIW